MSRRPWGDPMAAADAAAEAVRGLNHLTLGGGYVWPADVDAVVGSLGLLAQRLPQALEQAGRWLEAAHASGRVGHDCSGDVHLAVGEAIGDLESAARDAARLAQALEYARDNTSHLTGLAS